MNFAFAKRKRSLEELQEENERANLEYSIEQKRAMISRLHQAGLSNSQIKRNFSVGNKLDLNKAWEWFKTH
jgi:hypothetical protein